MTAGNSEVENLKQRIKAYRASTIILAILLFSVLSVMTWLQVSREPRSFDCDKRLRQLEVRLTSEVGT